MGRKTFQSLGKPLPGRRNIVISEHHQFAGIETFSNMESFLAHKFEEQAIWVIGGSQLYQQLLPHCSDLYLSLVYLDPEGDAFFPKFEDQFDLAGVIESYPEFEVRHYQRK